MHIPTPQIEAFFRVADTDNDGIITIDDIIRAGERLNKKISRRFLARFTRDKENFTLDDVVYITNMIDAFFKYQDEKKQKQQRGLASSSSSPPASSP
jgi:hypothetical protein